MGQKLSPEDAELYRRVDEVLHYIWDPIGVSDQPAARDEYEAYLPPVFRLLKGGSGPAEIAEYLDGVTSGSMGLRPDPAASLRVGEILIAYRRQILEQ